MLQLSICNSHVAIILIVIRKLQLSRLQSAKCHWSCCHFSIAIASVAILTVAIASVAIAFVAIVYTRLACMRFMRLAFQLTIEACRRAYPWQLNIGPNESFQILILLLQLQQNNPFCHYRNSKSAQPTSTAGHGAVNCKCQWKCR
jgi:hypothetical protein